MGEVSTIGLDIAKSVFQVHGVDDDGTVVVRKRVSRAKVLEFFSTLPSCVVGICDAAVDALCANQDRAATIRSDAASQPTTTGPSANDAVERDPRSPGRAWHYLGEGTQRHSRAVQDHC